MSAPPFYLPHLQSTATVQQLVEATCVVRERKIDPRGSLEFIGDFETSVGPYRLHLHICVEPIPRGPVN